MKSAFLLRVSNPLFACLVLLFLTNCGKSPEIPSTILGGGTLFDPSVYKPQQYLVSAAKPNPTSTEAQKPVIIACHGYSASTFEWSEFKDWSKNRTDYSISQVLLNGHGRTYADFKNSSWQDWQASIAVEYTKLKQAGYKRIDFVASSTSCTLLLEMIASGFFNSADTRINIMLVDPIIIPSDKTLSLVGIVGPMLGYVEADNTVEEDKYYYHYRPQETLQQLQEVLTKVRKQLEKGIVLPQNISVKVYKSKEDPTADPVSAVLIYNGIKTSKGNKIDLQMIDSKLHVFTNLSLRGSVSAKDQANQQAAFTDFITRVLK